MYYYKAFIVMSKDFSILQFRIIFAGIALLSNAVTMVVKWDYC